MIHGAPAWENWLAFVVMMLPLAITVLVFLYFTVQGIRSMIEGHKPWRNIQPPSVHGMPALDSPIVVRHQSGEVLLCVADFWSDAEVLDFANRFISNANNRDWSFRPDPTAPTLTQLHRTCCNKTPSRAHVTLVA